MLHNKQIVPAPTGYELRPHYGMVGVFVPMKSTNEFNWGLLPTIGVDIIAEAGTTLTRQDDTARRWYQSTKIDGAGFHCFYESTLAATDWWSFSFDCLIIKGGIVEITFTDTLDTVVYASRIFHSTGPYWQRDECYLTGMVPPGFFRIKARRIDDGAGAWYVDGLQLERKVWPTSFIQGVRPHWYMGESDQYWEGSPFYSRATRGHLDRSGGRLVRFKDAGLMVTGLIGLGESPVQHVTNPYAILPGTYHQRSRRRQRQFAIQGSFQTRSLVELMERRSTLRQILNVMRDFDDNPLVMRVQMEDDDGKLIGREFDIHCRYISGLEGNVVSDYGEDVRIVFAADDPYVWEPGDWIARGDFVNQSMVEQKARVWGDAPSPSIIELRGWGRLTRIWNYVSNQWIDCDITLPGNTNQILRFAPQNAYFETSCGLYNILTDALITDYAHAVQPVGHLPVFQLMGSNTWNDITDNYLRFYFTEDAPFSGSIEIYSRRTWSSPETFKDFDVSIWGK